MALPESDAFERGVRAKIGDRRIPFDFIAGNGSPLGDGPRSQALYDAVGSPDKTLKLYEGLLHEIFNEPEHPQVMADLAAWLEAHV